MPASLPLLNRLTYFSGMVAMAMLLFSSCLIVRPPYPDKPFVYKTNVNIQGKISGSERVEMLTRLENQLDDSIRVRTVNKFIVLKRLVKPPVFDTNSVLRSINFMDQLMNAMGYFESRIAWDSSLAIEGDQQRVTTNFTITTGKNLKLDSIAFDLKDSTLQALALRTRGQSLLQKGRSYSKNVVETELDRLVELYKNNGYYKISREDLYAEVDTVAAGLIDPTLDPFEQLQQLEALRLKRENPTIDVVIRQRVRANDHIEKFYIRNVSIYPELTVFDDSASKAALQPELVNKIKIYSKENKFHKKFLTRNTRILPGAEYRLRNYFRTISLFQQLGAWGQVSVDVVQVDSSNLLDVEINLYPNKKQSLTVDLEASRNSGDFVAVSNLLGLGVNVGLRNRNVAKESIQSSTNARGGIELGFGPQSNFIQTIQTSLSHTVYIPKIPSILTKLFNVDETNTTTRTVLNANGSYTNRRNFFDLRSINASVGFEINKSRTRAGVTKSHNFYYSPMNVEFVQLGRTDSLNKLINDIPNLEFAFNDGLVISQYFNYRFGHTRRNLTTSLRLGIEECGALFGLIKQLDERGNLFRYVKLDADIRHLITFVKSALAFRLYGGVGVPYGKKSDGSAEPSLPFFKAFYGGGPNSMRAWQVRRLGVGSSQYYNADNRKGIDRFADIQVEGNVEYRFNVATIGSVKLRSAVFTDIGNIWNRTDYNNPDLKNSDFRLDRFYRDLALAAGTSLRLDFEYFLIRFDWAYKLKNPAFADINNGWFRDIKFVNGQFQLGINYPF